LFRTRRDDEKLISPLLAGPQIVVDAGTVRRGPDGAWRKNEEELEWVLRVAPTALQNMVVLPLPVVEGWEYVGFRVTTFSEQMRMAKELLGDSTCASASSSIETEGELIVILPQGESRAEAGSCM
jgi:hypothetical protein